MMMMRCVTIVYGIVDIRHQTARVLVPAQSLECLRTIYQALPTGAMRELIQHGCYDKYKQRYGAYPLLRYVHYQ